MLSRVVNSLLFAVLIVSSTLQAKPKYSIYLDADYASAKASTLSIYQGINTALAEINYQLQGYEFEILIKDHSASPLTSRDNLKSYLKDDRALLVFSGLHSPPLISNRSFINNNKILLLDPWAAAASITRSDSKENWIFRLSIDDKSASKFIAESVLEKGFKHPYLLLEDTVWGHANFDNIKQVLKTNNISSAGITWFKWNVSLAQATSVIKQIDNSKADTVIFVGNAAEAKVFAEAVLTTKQKFERPVFSHWGITGGDFFEFISNTKGHCLNLTFIQTKFAFTNKNISDFAKKVLRNAILHNQGINSRQDIKAPAGFIHAYDLTQLLIAAINQVSLTGNRDIDKQAIHSALENLKRPVQGLIKTYNQPFGVYSNSNLDAHEALNASDYTFGKYDENGEIQLLGQPN